MTTLLARRSSSVAVAGSAIVLMASTVLASGSGWSTFTPTLSPAREGSTGVQLVPGTAGNGNKPCNHDNWVLTAGGQIDNTAFGAASSVTGAVQCFDPSQTTTGVNTATSMNTPSAYGALFQVPATTTCTDSSNSTHTITNPIVAAGGYDASGNVLSSSEVYDPHGDAWFTLNTSLSVARWGLDFGRSVVQLQDGRFLVVGGFTNVTTQPPTDAADIFDVAKCAWNVNDSGTAITPAVYSDGTNAIDIGYQSMGVLTNGHVVSCGGFFDVTGTVTTNCYNYTPSSKTSTGGGSWATGAQLNQKRAIAANSAYKENDTSCSSGGTTDYSCSERLPSNATFTHGRILLAFGDNDNTFNPENISKSEECDEATCTNAEFPVMRGSSGATNSRGSSTFANAVLLDNSANSYTGDVLVCGGYLKGGITMTDGCELYNPSTPGWSTTSVVDAAPRTFADAVFIETCTGTTGTTGSPAHGGSICSGSDSDEVIAAGGTIGVYSPSDNAKESNEIDRLTS